jgi:hypothetical protein
LVPPVPQVPATNWLPFNEMVRIIDELAEVSSSRTSHTSPYLVHPQRGIIDGQEAADELAGGDMRSINPSACLVIAIFREFVLFGRRSP